MMEVPTRHVAFFNEGVRSDGVWPMIARFTDDAGLAFANIPVCPFHSRNAIAAAYANQPPDDEIVLLRASMEGSLIIASYAWGSAPGDLAGDMTITVSGDRIARQVVAYGGQYQRPSS
jgi:hypothetical protein